MQKKMLLVGGFKRSLRRSLLGAAWNILSGIVPTLRRFGQRGTARCIYHSELSIQRIIEEHNSEYAWGNGGRHTFKIKKPVPFKQESAHACLCVPHLHAHAIHRRRSLFLLRCAHAHSRPHKEPPTLCGSDGDGTCIYMRICTRVYRHVHGHSYRSVHRSAYRHAYRDSVQRCVCRHVHSHTELLGRFREAIVAVH